MKFDDIPADTTTIRVKRTDFSPKLLKEQPVLGVKACPTRPGEFEIRLKDTVIFVKPVVEIDVRRLGNELVAGRAMISQFANVAANGSIELQIKFFTGECLEMGDVEVGVDEYVEKMIEKVGRKLSGQNLYKYLETRCCFFHGNEFFFFIIAGPAIDDELKTESEEKAKEEETKDNQEDADNPMEKTDENIDIEEPQLNPEVSAPKPEPTRKNSFCITGDNIRFVATETQLPDGKSIYISTRLTKLKDKNDRALRLARGKLKFIDWTKTGQIQILTKAQMNNLINNEGSYLKKWDEFGDFEGELLLKRARYIDVLRYCDVKQKNDGDVSVRILEPRASVENALKSGGVEEIEMVDELPDYLLNADLKFAEFVNGIEKDVEKKEKIEKIIGKQGKEEKKSLYFRISGYDNDSKILTIYDLESKKLKVETKMPPPSGMFVLSLKGEITQIKRRRSARKAILEGRCACTHLGLIIEEKGDIPPACKPPEIKTLTAFVRKQVFGEYQPTENQINAIKIALSTPDIALIQGPPGTGKTTIIAAILERLNELADKRQININGQVLLTGFQHDAVENMINRYWLNGIPIPKFGKRSGADKNDDSAFEKEMMKFYEKTTNELRAKNLNIAEVEKEMEIKNLCLQYINAPTRALAANLANKIASLDVTIIGEDISHRTAYIAKRLSHEETLNSESNPLLDAVHRLRIRTESFADDGPDRAAEAFGKLKNDEKIKNEIEKDEWDLLSMASLWIDNAVSPPFLKDLAVLKKKLMLKITAPPVFSVEKQNDEILMLAEKAIKKIKETGFSAKDKKSAALAEFLAELEENQYGMIDAVSDYSYAFAATCQQSVNILMQNKKGVTEKKKMEPFEYVIVDEAARVSPRDLMIPMAQGKRIILVGDHRQLPHIINDEVARQMEEGETGEEKVDWLKKSMFQYLFSERLKELEKKDGITRHITLDKQHRMHPLLGDFISSEFYDKSEQFRSSRPEGDFEHNLSGTDNKPAVWLDIPASKGRYQREGTSLIRPAEITAITGQIKIWMNSKEGENLSFGVISFYKAQADHIKEHLEGIRHDKKRLHVGTVDSFQSMEFDVVFLSMVRSLPQDWKQNDEDPEKQARKLFGRLCLDNLLNVSMSRQKKLLVAAGDSGLLNNSLARKYIPGLVNFFNLCREKGKVMPCL
ncbi:MAG: AAA family ATPase [Treponema sp.]|jgi:superfamily I DNA and/or RNA helicase|nr:AAA family ATPase [Treponema sp.]